MKKVFKNIGVLLLFVSALFYGCKDETEEQLSQTNKFGIVILKDDVITRFDKNKDLEITLESSKGLSVVSVEVLKDGKKITDATIVDNKTATFNASLLGDFDKFGTNKNEKYGSFSLELVVKFSDGSSFNRDCTVSVKKAIETSFNPTWKYLTKGEFKYNAIGFSNFDQVKFQISKDQQKTYIEEPFESIEKGSVVFYAEDYQKRGIKIGDKLFFKFIVKKGEQTEEIIDSVEIVPQTMIDGLFEFTKDNHFYNLQMQRSGEGLAEVQYKDNKISPMPSKDINFVKLSENQTYYDTVNIHKIKEDFESGDKLDEISNFKLNDIYLYKFTREFKRSSNDKVTYVYYGIIKIDKITKTEATDKEPAQDKVKIIFKEGTIILDKKE